MALTLVWPDTLISLSIVIVGGLLLNMVLRRLITAWVRSSIARAERIAAGGLPEPLKLLGRAAGLANERAEQRATTIGAMLRSVVGFLVTTVVILTAMSIIGIPMEPLLASAGVGGIAIAFGAQSLIKDFISGVFMMLEDQYGVGDLINTGDVTGTVEDVSLRITKLRDLSGQVWYVRNGEILRVGNQSQGWSTGVIDVPVSYDENPERVIGILKTVCADLWAEDEWRDILIEEPMVAGVNDISGGTMTMRIFAKCKTNQHWPVERELKGRAMQKMAAAGIKGPKLQAVPPER